MDPRDQAAMIQQLMQSPYMAQGAYGADQAAAAKMRRPDMPGINYANDPNVQAAREAALRDLAYTAGGAGLGALGAGMATSPFGGVGAPGGLIAGGMIGHGMATQRKP